MPRLTFYPIGNADCCLIDLANGKKILFDYADMRDPNSKDDRRCDLPKELREDLEAAKRDYYDAVAFTHLDSDHYKGASDFFSARARREVPVRGPDQVQLDVGPRRARSRRTQDPQGRGGPRSSRRRLGTASRKGRASGSSHGPNGSRTGARRTASTSRSGSTSSPTPAGPPRTSRC